MARGEYKTPGGKLVGVNVDVTTDGRVTDCHVDGDFFVDESGAADVDAKAYLSHGQTSSKFGPARRPADRASSHFMFQMFWAYSSTARSAEKKPALAMFTRDILLNRALSP